MFKKVLFCDNYEVNEFGIVRNQKGLNLKPKIDKGGYLVYTLVKNDKSKYYISAHRLVMINFNFIENYKELDVNHKDGNKQNNHISNLEWCTSKENTQHAIKHNLYKEKRKAVSDDTVIKIRKEYVPGNNGNYKELIEKYNVGQSMFFKIVTDQFRKDLPLTKDINPFYKEKTDKCSGENNGRSKLKKEDVIKIRAIKNPNIKEIALEYNVTGTCIRSILKYKIWKNI